jgi:hypothetical protein
VVLGSRVGPIDQILTEPFQPTAVAGIDQLIALHECIFTGNRPLGAVESDWRRQGGSHDPTIDGGADPDPCRGTRRVLTVGWIRRRNGRAGRIRAGRIRRCFGGSEQWREQPVLIQAGPSSAGPPAFATP